MAASREDLDAVYAVVEILEPFDTSDRERILRWSREKLGLASGGDILEMLFLVFSQSIQEANEDKKYWLSRLEELNEISKFMSEQLKELADASQKLAGHENEAEKVEVRRARVNWDALRLKTGKFDDPGLVDAPDEHVGRIDIREAGLVGTQAVKLSRAEIGAEIRHIESEMERLRSERQRVSTQFQHMDQIANQTMQTLARVLRAMADMRSLGAASRSGM